MKLKDIVTATNPISGQKVSLFDLGAIISLVMGGVLLIGVTAAAQNISKKVERTIPRMDMTIDSFGATPKAAPGKIRL